MAWTRNPVATAWIGAALVLAAASAPAQESKPEKPPVVTIVGASVSAGFVDPRPRKDGERNSTARLRTLVKSFWESGAVRVRDRSDLATFMSPVEKQTARIGRARKEDPALLIAIDFPFWFGYGYFAAPAERQTERRIERLEEGLKLLDGFTCPILLGDFPNMMGADPQMLSARQIPSKDTLAALNARLAEWAAERDHVRLFPLASWVAQAKAGGVSIAVDGDDVRLELADDPQNGDGESDPNGTRTKIVVPTTVLMQSDRLHASKLGMALLAKRLADAIGRLLPEGHALRPDVTLEDLIETAGAEETLEELLDGKDVPAAVR